MYVYSSKRTAQEVYDELYSRGGKEKESYIGGEHGAGTDDKITEFSTVLDIGCGMTQMIKRMADKGLGAFGCDISSVVVEKQSKLGNIVFWGDVTQGLEFEDNQFDVVCAFDVMEHIQPEAIEFVIKEIARIARHRILLTIAYTPARAKGTKGEQLHLTIQPQEWWIKQWEQVGQVEIIKRLKGIRRGRKAWGTAIMVTM